MDERQPHTEQLPEGPSQTTHQELEQRGVEAKQHAEDLTRQRDDLAAALRQLTAAYTQARSDLQQFVASRDAVSQNVDAPSLAERMHRAFDALFHPSMPPITDVAGFVHQRPQADGTLAYRQHGKKLRKTVAGPVRDAKAKARTEMDEALSFRGGLQAEETIAPRAASIQRMRDRVDALDRELQELTGVTIPAIRAASFEAWKRENPLEWEAMEKERVEAEQRKEQVKAKLALFREFLLTNPSNDELEAVARKNLGSPVCWEAKRVLMERNANILDAGFDPANPKDMDYMQGYVDELFRTRGNYSSLTHHKEAVRFIYRYLYSLPQALRSTVLHRIADYTVCRRDWDNDWNQASGRDVVYECGLFCLEESGDCISPSQYQSLPDEELEQFLKDMFLSRGKAKLYTKARSKFSKLLRAGDFDSEEEYLSFLGRRGGGSTEQMRQGADVVRRRLRAGSVSKPDLAFAQHASPELLADVEAQLVRGVTASVRQNLATLTQADVDDVASKLLSLGLDKKVIERAVSELMPHVQRREDLKRRLSA